MNKKYSLLISIIILTFSGLTFAQSTNPYITFSGESIKSNKDYTKNYNPVDCDPNILYNCMLDMINAARAEFFFSLPLKQNIKMDSIAQMQAEYQAQKMTRTIENIAPYKYTSQRLRLVGYTHRATELASKAKSSRGIEEYSYYDLCLELIKPILKNMKQAEILFDKKYTLIGIGVGVDKDMKNVYVSYVLGNDRTLNHGKPPVYQKEVPFTKSKMGLYDYDEQLCKKCMEDNNLEVLSEYIKLQGDDVYFICDDYKKLRKLIGKEDDAIVLDFVQESQYDCDKANIIDNDRLNRGFMTKPITYEMLLNANEITEKKSTKLQALIATVPEEITNNDFEVTVMILKAKSVCRTIIKKNIECKNAAYQEKIPFLKDETTIPIKGEFVPVAETESIEFLIPFSPNKTTFTFEDIAPFIQDLKKPYFTINKVDIIAHNSLNYSQDTKQIQLQKKRAESIKSAFQQKYGQNNISFNIEYNDSWEEFKRDVVYSEDYYDLTLFSKENAYEQLKKNKGEIAKALETDYLSKHRFAKIVLHITYSIEGSHEQDYVIYKFNQTVAQNNTALAMAIQKYIMLQIENKKYASKVVQNISIPMKTQFQPLLNNHFYMKCLVENNITESMCTEMEKIFALNPANPYVSFNHNLCKINGISLTSMNDINTMQMEIEKLYTYPLLPREKINSLNLEFQFKVIDYLEKSPQTMETATLLNSTYSKIKTIRNPKLDSWQNAYKLASIFIKNGDYNYALSLMDPFLTTPSISNDFIFSYVSVAGHKEDTYMSDNFANAVTLAAERDKTRLCNLIDKMSICISDNLKVKKVICKQCK